MDRSVFSFSHRLRVRWAEADLQGVVFNGHYLTYFDVGVTEYWRALAQGELSRVRPYIDCLQVVRATVEYHAAACFDDVIEVSVRTVRLGNSSLTCGFAIHRDEKHLISGENVYVHVRDGRSSRVPEGLRQGILDFEQTPPLIC